MSTRQVAIGQAVKGTAIALVTWGVLYVTKEQFGRTAALVVAVVLLVMFLLVVWARLRLLRANPPSD